MTVVTNANFHVKEKYMKKKSVSCIGLLGVLLVFSCKGAPAPAPEPPPPPPPVVEEPVVEETAPETVAEVYETYLPNLDLTGAQQYVVVRGDTLSGISRRFYGNLTNVGNAGPRNGFYFPVIMMASSANIPNPDRIYPGMRLTVPDLRRNLDNPGARQAIKNSLSEVAEIYARRRNANVTVLGLRRLSDSL